MLGLIDTSNDGGNGGTVGPNHPGTIPDADTAYFEGKKYSIKNRDFLITQLQKVNTLANNTTFNNAPVSSTWLYQDLANRMACFDIRDIRELQMGLFMGDVHLAISESGSIPQYFNTRTGVTLQGIGGDPGSKLFASTIGGGGTISYYTQYTESGVPIFAVVKGDSGFWQDVEKSAAIIGLVLSFTGVGAAIGTAVMGTAQAAAYPLIASAIGNISISTVLSGGDIGKAVQNGLLGMAAQGIGGYVGDASGSATIGQAAQAAANAALKGQNLAIAVASSAATNLGSQGIKMLNDTVDDSTDPDASSFNDAGFFPDLSNLDTNFNDVLNQLDLTATTLIPDSFGNIFNVTGNFVQLDPATYAQWLYTDDFGNIRDASNNVILTEDDVNNAIANNPNMTPDMAVKMALWDITVNATPTTVSAQPPTDTTPQNAPAPASQVKTPNASGMTWAEFASNAFKATMSYETARMQLLRTGRITPSYLTGTGTPYSQVTGLPVVQADGSIVVRNANGTQTITYPNGQTQTIGGVAQIAGINQNTLIIGAAVLAGLLILER